MKTPPESGNEKGVFRVLTLLSASGLAAKSTGHLRQATRLIAHSHQISPKSCRWVGLTVASTTPCAMRNAGLLWVSNFATLFTATALVVDSGCSLVVGNGGAGGAPSSSTARTGSRASGGTSVGESKSGSTSKHRSTSGGGGAGGTSTGRSASTGSGKSSAGGRDASAGSGADAGGVDRGPDGASRLPPYQNSAATTRILAQAALARSGKPADFDGDGRAEFVPVLDGMGGVTVTVDPTGSGNTAFTYVYDAQALTATYTLDPAENGQGEITIAIDIAAHQTVTTEDTDFDGNPDYILTQTVDPTARTVQVMVQTAPNNDGNFTTIKNTTASSDLNCTGTGDGLGSGFPSNASYQVQDGPVTIESNNGAEFSGGSGDGSDGSCSAPHTAALEAAIDCALSTGASCLQGTNAAAAFLLDVALTYGSWQLSCGNCAAGATTAGNNVCGPGSTGCAPVQTSFSASGLDSNSPTTECDAMLHEMLHWAGVPADDSTHDLGTDQVLRLWALLRRMRRGQHLHAAEPRHHEEQRLCHLRGERGREGPMRYHHFRGRRRQLRSLPQRPCLPWRELRPAPVLDDA